MLNKTYEQDGRLPIDQLYKSYFSLGKKAGWIKEEIYPQKPSFPIVALYTQNSGPAIWVISGIHGDEPAGPISIASNVASFTSLDQKGVPLVLLPLCNPLGYTRNWRYPYHPKEIKLGKSVGDSEYLLPNLKNPQVPRAKKPSCPEALALNSWIIKMVKIFPPLLVIDLHEDEILTAGGDPYYHDKDEEKYYPYIYSQGKLGVNDPVAKEIVRIFIKHHHPLQMSGIAKTEFKEKIVGGVVAGMKDGSVSELLAAEKIIIEGKSVPGPGAKTVTSVETLTATLGYPLSVRLQIHGEILRSLERFWLLVKK